MHHKCVEAYFKGESPETASETIIILDGASRQNERAKYVLFYNREKQFLHTKNALHTSVVSIKNGNGMVQDAGMEAPEKEAEPEITGENYKEILESVRKNYPDMPFLEAQKMASKINTERKAA